MTGSQPSQIDLHLHPGPGSRPRLAELTIRDFAIVDSLHIDWAGRFIALTGETGAGKSIIIDALGAALGDRFDPIWLRSGAERGSVEAIFCNVEQAPVAATLEELGCEGDPDSLVLARDVQPTRSVARVNGRAVPLGAVQQVAEQLVDVHSQASHLSLSRPAQHLAILDRYGRALDLRNQMMLAAREVRTLRREIERLDSDDRGAQREAARLRHEIDEIDAAGTHPGEEEELAIQRSRLKNALHLRQLAESVHDALQGADEGPGAIELLGSALAQTEEMLGLDASFGGESARLIEAIDAAEDLARTARRYGDAIEEDPEALGTVEERLVLLAELKRKYGSSLDNVFAYLETATSRLDELEHSEVRIEQLRADEAEARERAARIAERLSALRAEAARTLEQMVQSEMTALGMPGARFGVQMTRRPDAEGLEVAGSVEPVAFDETGIDRVEFVMSANPGEPPRPLAQIASGGELSRFMLALKSALSAVDETPVLIFDELDQGIGGRMGHVVGEKLWRLSLSHQILCITHLPQVAAYADSHYAVVKVAEGGRTVTRVTRLGDEERQREIAQMLGGAGGGTMGETAKELLGNAAQWKQEQGQP